ncbi:MAG: class II aldolase/adducin family protein [Endomicrobia bacterium]|nr:class II aldolase/adducin family protein [Endomicrobiia bacterium]MCX7716030.1 class II aldolase/adducin family protein [Endomicrobiia bacterium]
MQKLIFQHRKEIIDWCKYLAEREFMIATDGNISVRLDNRRLLITPKGKDKRTLHPQDLVIMDINGNKVEGMLEPSGEWRLHTTIYTVRDDVNAVVHTHPVYTTALSVAGISLLEPVLPEVVITIDGVPLVEYGLLYTEDLANKLKKYLYNYNAFMLKNHGLVTIGENLNTAVFATLKVEHLSKIIFIAKTFGKIDVLSDDQVAQLLNLKKFLR